MTEKIRMTCECEDARCLGGCTQLPRLHLTQQARKEDTLAAVRTDCGTFWLCLVCREHGHMTTQIRRSAEKASHRQAAS